GGVKGIGNLDGQRQDHLGFNRAPRDPVFQGYSIQKLHHQERAVVLLSDFVNGADVGMIQGGSRLRLPLEARQRLCVLGYLIRQELQGDKSVEVYVLALVNDTHATTAEFLNDAV